MHSTIFLHNQIFRSPELCMNCVLAKDTRNDNAMTHTCKITWMLPSPRLRINSARISGGGFQGTPVILLQLLQSVSKFRLPSVCNLDRDTNKLFTIYRH